jgi:hypothetical protein
MRLTLEPRVRCFLRQPTIALDLQREDLTRDKPVLTRIEAGKTIEIEGSAPDQTGLVEVKQDGRSYAMFADDLRERARLVSDTPDGDYEQ